MDVKIDSMNTLRTQTPRIFWLTPCQDRPCPLCGKREYAAVSRKMQHKLNLQTVICKRCTFVYTNPAPFKGKYESFYNEAYLHYYGSISGKTLWVPAEKEPSHIKDILDLLAAHLPAHRRKLLEIGPGRGQLLYWAKRRRWQVQGVEPSEEFCRNMGELGIPFYQGTVVEVAELANESPFDAIVLQHVLEHFYSPEEGLIACLKLLARGGLLYISVPNILRPYRSLDNYFFRYVHPSNFSPATLRFLLESNGLTIIWEDEGGKDWQSPQNLKVLAYKSRRSCTRETSLPQDDYRIVLSLLQRYRIKWKVYGSIRWHSWHAFRAVVSKVKGGTRKLLSMTSYGRTILAARRQKLENKGPAS